MGLDAAERGRLRGVREHGGKSIVTPRGTTSTGHVAFSISFWACALSITLAAARLDARADDEQIDLALVARQRRVEAVGERPGGVDRRVVAGNVPARRPGGCAMPR